MLNAKRAQQKTQKFLSEKLRELGYSADPEKVLKLKWQDLEKLLDACASAHYEHKLKMWASSVAHDLCNPIGGIQGFTQLLLQGTNFTDQQRKDLETIQLQVRRCQEILKGLTDLANNSGTSFP